jgi:hypothetical protein
MNRISNARWTSDPLVAGTLGGSGSFSMLANRNCNGHDVNASTRLGDKLVGTVKLRGKTVASINAIVRDGCYKVEFMTRSPPPSGEQVIWRSQHCLSEASPNAAKREARNEPERSK